MSEKIYDNLGWEPISTLPNNYFAVLLWDGSNVSMGRRVSGSIDEFDAYTEQGEVFGSEFTHWMPLPAPPKRLWPENDQGTTNDQAR